MHIFVPYDNSPLARVALQAAYRMAGPLDEVIAMASVIVPTYLPIDVEIDAIWKSFFRAEWRLIEAQEQADIVARSGDSLRCVRVQARDHASAIIAGAAHFHADVLVLAEYASIWRNVVRHFGELSRILREAPCNVHLVYVPPDRQGSRYLDDPWDARTVMRLSVPFQQPLPVAIREATGTPDDRIDVVIRSIRLKGREHASSS